MDTERIAVRASSPVFALNKETLRSFRNSVRGLGERTDEQRNASMITSDTTCTSGNCCCCAGLSD